MGGRSGQAIRKTAVNNSVGDNTATNDSAQFSKTNFKASGFSSKEETVNFAKVAGLPASYEGDVTIFKSGNLVTMIAKNADITMQRQINLTEKSINNQLFVINERGTNRKYKGSDIFNQQVKEAQKQGFTKIKTEAEYGKTSDGKGNLNGYYTWLRLGYKPNKTYDKKYTEKFNKDTGGNIKSITDLMHTEAGRSWWKTNGGKFKGEFDLFNNSYSNKVLNNYKKS